MTYSRLPLLALVMLWTGCGLLDSDQRHTRMVEMIEPHFAMDQSDTLAGSVRIRATAIDDGRGVSRIHIRLREMPVQDNSQAVTLAKLSYDVSPRRPEVSIDTILVLPPDLVLVADPAGPADDVFYELEVITSDGTNSSGTGLRYRRIDNSLGG
ncbi:MAG TPA: hypothetical protein VF190_05800 [Rhodothermales bacterium]